MKHLVSMCLSQTSVLGSENSVGYFFRCNFLEIQFLKIPIGDGGDNND